MNVTFFLRVPQKLIPNYLCTSTMKHPSKGTLLELGLKEFLPILAHKCSNLIPEVKRWHLSGFISISQLFLNHSIGMIECSSNLVRTEFKFLPQT